MSTIDPFTGELSNIRPSYSYGAGFSELPDSARLKVRAWANRLQAKTHVGVLYRFSRRSVEVWHGDMSNRDHNRAVRSLAGILDRSLGYR